VKFVSSVLAVNRDFFIVRVRVEEDLELSLQYKLLISAVSRIPGKSSAT